MAIEFSAELTEIKRSKAHKETGLGFAQFPTPCPWDLGLALQDDWLPGEDGAEQTVASDRPT